MIEERKILESLKMGNRETLIDVYLTYRIDFLDWAIKRQGCSLRLAKEVYQQTILDLFELLSFKKVNRLSSSLKTYVFALGKNRFQERNLQLKTLSDKANNESASISDDWKNVESIDAIPMEEMSQCLDALDSSSRALLLAYYYEKQSMQEICRRLGFSHETSAKQMKYACLQKMKNVF